VLASELRTSIVEVIFFQFLIFNIYVNFLCVGECVNCRFGF